MVDKQVGKLKELGLKITPQRLAILDFLDGNTSHPAAIDIYRNLKKKYPSMSMATVYNTVDVLAKNGMLLELPITKDKLNYDPDTSAHDHAFCSRCGKIFDIFPDKAAIPAEPQSVALEGFNVVSVRKVYYVECKDCIGKKGG